MTDIVAQAEEIHISDTLAYRPRVAVAGRRRRRPHPPIDDTLTVADAVAADRAWLLRTSSRLPTRRAAAAYQRTVADTVGLADSLSTSGAGAQPIADTLAVADAVAFAVYQRTSDTVTADAVAFRPSTSATVADTITATDGVTATVASLHRLTRSRSPTRSMCTRTSAWRTPSRSTTT